MAGKKKAPTKLTTLKEKLDVAYGKMKEDRKKSRAAKKEMCDCGDPKCKGCDCET